MIKEVWIGSEPYGQNEFSQVRFPNRVSSFHPIGTSKVAPWKDSRASYPACDFELSLHLRAISDSLSGNLGTALPAARSWPNRSGVSNCRHV
jgi:hypothetical protein